MSKFLLMATVFLAFAGITAAADTPAADGAKAKPYPLKTCIVTNDELDEDAASKVYGGQEIKVCCKKCFKDFEKDQAKYLKKLEGAAHGHEPKDGKKPDHKPDHKHDN
jgi:hypothetical protein